MRRVDQVAQTIGRGPNHELPTMFMQSKHIQQVLNIFLNGWMDDG